MKYKYNNFKYSIVSFKLKFYCFFLMAGLMNFGCHKFLDIKPNSQITLIETANDAQLLLNNYSSMNAAYPSDGEASSDDYFLSNDAYNSNNTEDQGIYVWNFGAIHSLASPQWQTSYYTAYQANLAFETADKLKGKENDAVLNSIKGQSLFFRAYAFWNIAQLYCKPYSNVTANADLGIPLRLSSNISDKSNRGTVQQTYDQIINDLKDAVNLLDPTSLVASRPNKIAAYAMLARVYLSMEDYSNALINANLALQLKGDLINYNTIDTTNSTPFSRFNTEVIFQSLTVSDQLLDPGSETSPMARINLDLYNSYSVNDLRRVIFFKQNKSQDIAGDYKFDGTFRFTGNYDQSAGAAQFNGLAVDEIYLIRAECNARKGDINSAMADLNTLLRTRWKTNTYTDMVAASADDALLKVLNERRKELVMRCSRWTDLRRLNKDNRFAKTLTRTINDAIYTLPPDDSRYILLIPQEVINNAGLQQNTR